MSALLLLLHALLWLCCCCCFRRYGCAAVATFPTAELRCACSACAAAVFTVTLVTAAHVPLLVLVVL
jgi:hypothetical protein